MSLVFDRQYLPPLVAVLAYYLLKPDNGTFMEHMAILLPLAAGMLLYSLFVMAPRRA